MIERLKLFKSVNKKESRPKYQTDYSLKGKSLESRAALYSVRRNTEEPDDFLRRRAFQAALDQGFVENDLTAALELIIGKCKKGWNEDDRIKKIEILRLINIFGDNITHQNVSELLFNAYNGATDDNPLKKV